jgi:hypothetical protein
MEMPWLTPFSGEVMADETYIGSDPKNWHANDPRRAVAGRGTHKIPVASLIDADTGEVRSAVIPDVTAFTLSDVILENVDPIGSTLVTDGWKGYDPVGRQFAKHEQVDHNKGVYSKNGYSTNAVEGSSRS